MGVSPLGTNMYVHPSPHKCGTNDQLVYVPVRAERWTVVCELVLVREVLITH